MRKADLSINMIIMAVIGVVILILVIAIFTGKVKIFSKNVEGSCTDQGGKCMYNEPYQKCSDLNIVKWTTGCDCVGCDAGKQKTGQCCIPLG